MAFWNSTIRVCNPACGANFTAFTVQALQQVVGRNDTVRQLDDRTYFVGQRLNGSYAVRVIPTGGEGELARREAARQRGSAWLD